MVKKQDKKTVGNMEPYRGSNWAYDLQGKLPFFWLSKAYELRRASTLIWQGVEQDFEDLRRIARNNELAKEYQHQPSVMYTFVFLSALAIENLLKALIVIKHPENIEKGKLRGDVINKHDLIMLADKAKVILSAGENQFCELGTSAIRGWGRYPIPTNISEMKSQIKIDRDIGEVFDTFFNRLENVIRDRTQNR